MSSPALRLIRRGLLAAALTLLSPLAFSAEAITPDGGRYTGPLVNGVRQGEGVVVWENGMRYQGGFEGGLFSGQGKLNMPSGHLYEGEFRQGMMAGKGRLETSQGAVYTGEFRQSMFWGQGEMTMTNGRKYRGGFERHRFNGKGRYEMPQGVVFEGDFVNDEFTGQGSHLVGDGGRYEGAFKNWRLEGPGKYVGADGTEYAGEFKGGELTTGSRVTKDGSRYEGGFRASRPQGQGTLTLANGDRYVGGFKYGMYDGQGTLTLATAGADGKKEQSGVWRYGRLPDVEKDRLTEANIETALYNQRQLLDAALAALKPREAGRTNLYLLTVAGDGTQEVFHRETGFVREQFDRDFGTAGRSLALINSRNTVATAPLATLTSLRESLQRIATLMDKDNDILFLYLTSHGSRKHEFSLDMERMDFADIKAAELAQLLKDSGIRHKVVVISACFSGGFIPLLKDEHSLVIAAARQDRTSFGCSDENDFTYFGRAFFKEALPQSRSFPDAFRRAEKLIGEWEDRDAESDKNADEGDDPGFAEDDDDSENIAEADDSAASAPAAVADLNGVVQKTEDKSDPHRSFPQIASSDAIERKLDAWWKQHRASVKKSSRR
ncbi:MAG: hypothetical protein K0Q68_797 [Moraxellaceae bacterium]|jgi:hypothetical protein|nr:hypothetical protein [Moraxellaceae bacterium]